MGGTRILVGRYDGTQDAAVLVNGLDDRAFGPMFTGDDPAEQAEAFLAWLAGGAWLRAPEIFGGESSKLPRLDREDGGDARRWTSAELDLLYSHWRGFYLDDDGDVLLDPQQCECGHRHAAGDFGQDVGCTEPSCLPHPWAPGNRVAARAVEEAAARDAEYDHLGIR